MAIDRKGNDMKGRLREGLPFGVKRKERYEITQYTGGG